MNRERPTIKLPSSHDHQEDPNAEAIKTFFRDDELVDKRPKIELPEVPKEMKAEQRAQEEAETIKRLQKMAEKRVQAWIDAGMQPAEREEGLRMVVEDLKEAYEEMELQKDEKKKDFNERSQKALEDLMEAQIELQVLQRRIKEMSNGDSEASREAKQEIEWRNRVITSGKKIEATITELKKKIKLLEAASQEEDMAPGIHRQRKAISDLPVRRKELAYLESLASDPVEMRLIEVESQRYQSTQITAPLERPTLVPLPEVEQPVVELPAAKPAKPPYKMAPREVKISGGLNVEVAQPIPGRRRTERPKSEPYHVGNFFADTARGLWKMVSSLFGGHTEAPKAWSSVVPIGDAKEGARVRESRERTTSKKASLEIKTRYEAIADEDAQVEALLLRDTRAQQIQKALQTHKKEMSQQTLKMYERQLEARRGALRKQLRDDRDDEDSQAHQIGAK